MKMVRVKVMQGKGLEKDRFAGAIITASQLDIAYCCGKTQKQGLASTFKQTSHCDSNAMDINRKKSNGICL